MSKYKFLFDLDSTLTKKEILPTISEMINKREEMQQLTERTMLGEIPFEESFRSRVKILSDLPVSTVCGMISEIPLLDNLIQFLRDNKERCFIVTSNLDVWIIELMKKMGMENNFYSSKALVKNDKIVDIESILLKEEVVKKIGGPVIAVGDGNNDAEMIKQADVGIGFGGVRPIAVSVKQNADYEAYSEEELCELLKHFL